MLCSVEFLVCDDYFRGTELLSHLLAVVNPSESLENDPVVYIESLLDDEDVVQLVLDDDLTLMHHVIFVDDVDYRLPMVS